MRVRVPVRRTRVHANPLPLPAYMSEGAAGLDLRADVDEDLVLPPMGRARVPTGLSVAIPPGWEGQVRPRSGLALDHGVTCLNSPGTVDSDYRGEIGVILANLSERAFTVRRGDRIAQLVLCPVGRAELVETDALPESARGGGGFGSTGRAG